VFNSQTPTSNGGTENDTSCSHSFVRRFIKCLVRKVCDSVTGLGPICVSPHATRHRRESAIFKPTPELLHDVCKIRYSCRRQEAWAAQHCSRNLCRLLSGHPQPCHLIASRTPHSDWKLQLHDSSAHKRCSIVMMYCPNLCCLVYGLRLLFACIFACA